MISLSTQLTVFTSTRSGGPLQAQITVIPYLGGPQTKQASQLMVVEPMPDALIQTRATFRRSPHAMMGHVVMKIALLYI